MDVLQLLAAFGMNICYDVTGVRVDCESGPYTPFESVGQFVTNSLLILTNDIN